MLRLCTIGLMFVAPTVCFADQEIPPTPVLFSTDSGYYFVKSVPESPSRWSQTAGVTRVYRTGSNADKLLCEYPWYAHRLYLFFDGNDLTLVRLGPWHRAGTAPENGIEIGFYRNGRTVKEYTVADIALSEKNFVHSISHYQITGRVKGIVQGSHANYFEIHTMDGRDLRFDMRNGERLEAAGKTDTSGRN